MQLWVVEGFHKFHITVFAPAIKNNKEFRIKNILTLVFAWTLKTQTTNCVREVISKSEPLLMIYISK